MGALYLTNALLPHGITTHLLPSDASTEDLDAAIAKYDPIAVGCSVMTAPEIIDFVHHSVHVQVNYNSAFKRIPVIWGGMHPTIVWQQTIAEPYIDIVVSGEAEITLPRILLDLIDRNELPLERPVRVETPPQSGLVPSAVGGTSICRGTCSPSHIRCTPRSSSTSRTSSTTC